MDQPDFASDLERLHQESDQLAAFIRGHGGNLTPEQVFTVLIAQYLYSLKDRAIAEVKAEPRQPVTLSHPGIIAIQNSDEGTAWILAHLLQKHQPELSQDQAYQILEQCMAEHGQEYLVQKVNQTIGQAAESQKKTTINQRKK